MKTAYETKDVESIKTKTEALDAAWMAASEEMYAQGQPEGGAQQDAPNDGTEDVQDADFEEVK